MDAFEQVIGGLLFQEGYWVSQSFKVELTKDEKKQIGRPSSPRWEIDLLAYSGGRKELLVVECKSYLDSGGVSAKDILSGDKNNSRYKLFVDDHLRDVVFRRLSIQLAELGLVPGSTIPRLALAAGKIRSPKDKELLLELFNNKEWRLLGPEWIVSKLLSSADESYFDSIAHVVSKLIKRNPI